MPIRYLYWAPRVDTWKLSDRTWSWGKCFVWASGIPGFWLVNVMFSPSQGFVQYNLLSVLFVTKFFIRYCSLFIYLFIYSNHHSHTCCVDQVFVWWKGLPPTGDISNEELIWNSLETFLENLILVYPNIILHRCEI